jgi:hypothetical protein
MVAVRAKSENGYDRHPDDEVLAVYVGLSVMEIDIGLKKGLLGTSELVGLNPDCQFAPARNKKLRSLSVSLRYSVN